MKNILKLIVLFSLCFSLIFGATGCGNNNLIDEDKATVVCTGFAQYDWVLNILGSEASNWNVVRLNDKGADMHSYQPSASDMILLNQADLVIYTGGLSEEWVSEATKDDGFGGQAYALLEHGQPICIEEDHEEHEGHDHHTHGHDAKEYDEHIWLSLENAKNFCQDIASLMNDVSPSQKYSENCKTYTDKLDSLKVRYENVLEAGEEKTLIFADRFPFRYLAEDYHLHWYAAFPGCSAETEASFATIKELSSVVTEHKPSAIFVTETGDDSLAKTVIDNAKFKEVSILEVNSMQSIAAKEDTSYIEIMEDNLALIEAALS